MKNMNLMIIGFGRHCKRIYYPLYLKYMEKYNISLKAIVDIKSEESGIEEYLNNNEKSERIYFENNNLDNFKLNKKEKNVLNQLVEKYNINSVIISSEPSSHRAYIEWALDKKISILMDKPITSRKNSSINTKEAKKIMTDYNSIEKKYLKIVKDNPKLIISCMSQRRYHPAMNKIITEINKVSQRTNCPVTSMSVLHSDGQWRMPQEILDEKYHGYNEGYGKCSHSGYHFFDMISLIIDNSIKNTKNKEISFVKINSDFIRPIDTLSQLNYDDYSTLFGQEFVDYTKEKKFSSKRFKNMGEIDAFMNFSFRNKENHKICSVNLSLIHNGFSRRSWFKPKKDLYKGNGRVRHESFIIEQGPFQSIHYHSYQSDEIRNISLKDKSNIGGELHSEVTIYRNSKLLNDKAFERINFGEIKPNNLEGYSRGHQEEARGNCFVEFFEFLQENIQRENLKSEIIDHKHGVILMSGSYISGAKEFQNSTSIVKTKYLQNGE